jgi:glucose uptake protein GlcU
VAGILFGSQFIPSKFCPDFRSGSYNVSMAIGILLGSAVALPVLGISDLAPNLAALAFLAGLVWVAGNYLLVFAVANAGMARAFIVVNFSAVFSFLGGVAFLGELTEVSAVRLVLIAAGIGLVLAGAFLVGTTTPGKKAQGAPGGPSVLLASASKARLRRREAQGADGGKMRLGLVAVFFATIFFSAYNVMIAYSINKAVAPAGPIFIFIAPGAVAGAILAALFARRGELPVWRAAPVKWHLLALSQGLVWATAMVCIMFGWKGTGIAMGTPIQVGVQTLVSSLWGLVMFGELKGLGNASKAYAKFAAGAALTVVGIALIAFG